MEREPLDYNESLNMRSDFPVNGKHNKLLSFLITNITLLLFTDSKYPYTPMNLMINGSVDSGVLADHDGICVKYDFAFGKDWHLHAGNSTGIS